MSLLVGKRRKNVQTIISMSQRLANQGRGKEGKNRKTRKGRKRLKEKAESPLPDLSSVLAEEQGEIAEKGGGGGYAGKESEVKEKRENERERERDTHPA